MGMKKLCLLLIPALALVSCNTTIGLGRDVRDGFNWTKDKVQESRNNGRHSDDYVAPVY